MVPVSKEKLNKRKGNIESCEIHDKVKDFLKNRKNSNNLIDIINALMCKNVEAVIAAQNGIQKIFISLLQKEEMTIHAYSSVDVEVKYKIWLHETYLDAKNGLLNLLSDDCVHVQKLSLEILMKFVTFEGKHPIKPYKENRIYFPSYLLKQILSVLLSNTKEMSCVLNRFQEFLDYDDVRFYTLKLMVQILKQHTKDGASIFLENAFAVLSQVRPPENLQTNKQSLNFLVTPHDGKLHCTLKYNNARKLFSATWLELLTYEISRNLQKKILIILHDKVLPYISEPILLTDFLTEAYNSGGVVSLLALNSLFFLIQNCNLEYPDFYIKLYNLFQPDILYTKYRSRFLFLADLFLNSTHLPSYLVAAFCKRLARLALAAPPDCLLIVIPFIGNLLIRHPHLKVLIHNPDALDLANDPFDIDEPNPANCHALESSLWELKTLQFHWHPDVHAKAKFIETTLPQIEWEISGLLETRVTDLMDKVSRKKFKQVHLSYDQPSKLFSRQEDKMNTWWILT